jgi:L-ascorbate metabolism protein UlaG (beta-lactamase superfamily)
MKIQLLRHATCLISVKGKQLLLDPVLSPAGEMAAIPKVPNPANNPLVELPGNINVPDLLSQLDAIIVTHTHRDHLDKAAMEMLPKDLPLFCQPQDIAKIQAAGFIKVHPIMESFCWDGLTITRTTGKHGTGFIGYQMGAVSGFVLKAVNEPVLYITGDTIWCAKIKQALTKHQPQVILCFAGGAQFHTGRSITMNKFDIDKLARNAPQTKIMAVHMEAWNHCRLSRKELQAFLKETSITKQVIVPENGEELTFT